MFKTTAISVSVLLLLLTPVFADHVEVRRSATIKQEPHYQAVILLRPKVGDLFNLAEENQTNGYYKVQLPAGRVGWIYRTLVRRHRGPVPGATTSTITANSGEVDLMWWNIRDLSDSSRDDTEMKQIAKVIKGMDVVAIGELNDPKAIERLATQMGSTWKHAASEKVGRTSGSKEHYGFIWDSNVVSMVGSIQVYSDPGNKIDREPAFATFRTTDSKLDFTVIAVHITWGRLVGPRKAEIQEMDAVWKEVQDSNSEDDDLILVGDFNRNVGDDSFDELLGIGRMTRANEDTGATHISSTSTYDQVFLDLDHTSEWTGSFTTLRFDETQFNNDDTAANLAVSDHRPVTIKLRVPVGDDD